MGSTLTVVLAVTPVMVQPVTLPTRLWPFDCSVPAQSGPSLAVLCATIVLLIVTAPAALSPPPLPGVRTPSPAVLSASVTLLRVRVPAVIDAPAAAAIAEVSSPQ